MPKPGGGTSAQGPTAPNSNAPANTYEPNVSKLADIKARSTVRPVSSRSSRPIAASSAARPLSRTVQSVPNQATEATSGSSASGSGAYYGGAVAYNAALSSTNTTAAVSTAAISSVTSGSSSQSFPYYTVAPSAPAAAAPSLYGNYAAAPAAPAPVAYNYAAPAAPAQSAAYNYGQSGMNPYLLTSTAPANAFSGTMDTNASFSGPLDTSAQHSMFIPQQPVPTGPNRQSLSHSTYQPYNSAEFEDDPPLLEELGINVEHIVAKTRSVVLPFSRFKGTISDAAVIQDADLAGPIALGLLLGGELMLSGKLQFGYIYGFGLFGCVSMTLILNFMSPAEAISLWTVTSILGYSLLPVNLLAAVKLLVVNLGNLQLLGQFLGFLTVVWCTIASTRLMEQGCGMRDQRYLIAYPIGLLYTAFVMITIF